MVSFVNAVTGQSKKFANHCHSCRAPIISKSPSSIMITKSTVERMKAKLSRDLNYSQESLALSFRALDGEMVRFQDHADVVIGIKEKANHANLKILLLLEII